jgi:hypothetical protein
VSGGGLPRGLSGKQIVAALERDGWRSARIKGDHQIATWFPYLTVIESTGRM